ncbi:MAG: methyl-accepting chemotaxis protein [Thermacetogeniaceae bacterium]
MLAFAACFLVGAAAGAGVAWLAAKGSVNGAGESAAGEAAAPTPGPDEERDAGLSAEDLCRVLAVLRDAVSLVSGVLDDARREAGEAGERWARAVGEVVDRANSGLRRLQKTIGELAAEEGAGSAGVVDQARHTARSLVASSRAVVEELVSSGDSYLRTMQEVQAGRFRGIAEEIRKILRQTNIVAINARIEAAHLGEIGSGFSVIAGEVMKLSGMIGESVKLLDETAAVVEERLKEFAAEISSKAERASRVCEDSERLLGEYLAELERRANDIVSGLRGSGREIDKVLDTLSGVVDALQYHDISYQKVSNAVGILEDVRKELERALDGLKRGDAGAIGREIFEGFKERYTMRAERLRHELATGQSCLDERRVGRVEEELGENVELF